MLFGQSVFQSVVERLNQEAEEQAQEEAVTPHKTVTGFTTSFVLETERPDPERFGAAFDAYLDFLPDPPEPEPEPEPMPAYLERTSLADVSDELAIDDKDTVESLSEKRRAFAKLNHPDRLSPDFRANAHARMTAANLLIDQAIKLISR
jgi:hypothetical protein